MLGQNQTLCSFYAWGGKTEIWAGFAGDLFGILKQQFTLNGLIFARIDFFRICFCDNWIFFGFFANWWPFKQDIYEIYLRECDVQRKYSLICD